MDFDSARIKMVDNQIRTTDVTDLGILRAFLAVPREAFVPEQRRPLAYIDGDVPVGSGRFLMEPSPFAKLLQLAAIAPGETILDIGCATGYSSAIAASLGGPVVALEEDVGLAAAARENLAGLGLSTVSVVEGPLEAGYPSKGPYDVILLQGSVEVLPAALFDQMAEGGRLLVVEGMGNAAAAKLYLKEDGRVSGRFGFNCSIQPLPGFRRSAAFVF